MERGCFRSATSQSAILSYAELPAFYVARETWDLYKECRVTRIKLFAWAWATFGTMDHRGPGRTHGIGAWTRGAICYFDI